MKLVLVLIYVALCKVSAVTENYNAHCPSGSTVRVEVPDIGRMSKFEEYKELVCVACGVANCKESRLFEGNKKKNDGDRIMSTGNLEGLSLKNYESDEIEVSYECPGVDVQTVCCYTSLVGRCDECKILTEYEVYAGTKKVSSGKVATSRGIYQVDIKASKLEKVKQSMEKIKKYVTSDKAKGFASVVGATVITNKDKILDVAKVIGLPEETANNMEQIIRLGNSFYTKDVDGGLRALAELTGRPLSKEEEQAIEKELEDGEIDYADLLTVVESESEDILRDKDLYQAAQDTIAMLWDNYGLYIIIGVAIMTVICLMPFEISFHVCIGCVRSNTVTTVYQPAATQENESTVNSHDTPAT